MKTLASLFLVLGLGLISRIRDVNCGIEDWTKEDLFAIYSHTAFAIREIKQGQITPDQVSFYLFTNESPKNYTILNPSNPKELDTNATIVLLIHGWTETREKQWYEDLKNAFLSRYPNFYVVQVDWRKPANQYYTVASYNTKEVGEIIGKYIVNWNKNFSIPLDNFLVVGHSLGGQVAGFVGKTVQKLTNQKLPRIIALDPAGPFFTSRPDEERLNKFDATVVECLHTNGGTFGFLDSCGTIDFHPNGGVIQPGCSRVNISDFGGISDTLLCDHHRSWAYFTEALLEPENFEATKCSSTARYALGMCRQEEYVSLGDLETTKTGDFYFETNRASPFGRARRTHGILQNLAKLRL